MLSFIKRHIFIILIFIFTLSVTFLTFLTFIGKSFILVSENNLNYLLYLNIGLLVFFFIIIFREISISIHSYFLQTKYWPEFSTVWKTQSYPQ